MARKKAILFFISLLFSFLILEFSIYILTKRKSFPIKTPSYSLENVSSRSGFVLDINPDFGVWHRPYSEYRHKKSCFNVKYQANSYGARDIERSLDAKGRKRVIFLGDSMVEGYGVQLEKRLTNMLENELNIEHLNFGTGGNFGTTQYYLLYKTLGSKFEHHAVIIGVLPTNDFLDDDYNYGQKAHRNRYRPYFIGKYPNYKRIYYRETLAESTFHQKTKNIAHLSSLLSEFTFSYNAFLYVKSFLFTRRGSYSGYYDFTEEQFQRMKYALENIIQEANGKNLAIIAIPLLHDFQRYAPLKEEPPLSKKLRELAENNDVTYVDLLAYMANFSENGAEYYLPCDGHWNEYGHFIAARYLAGSLPMYKKLVP